MCRHDTKGLWLSGGLGCVTFTVGLDDPKGLFQPKRFNDYTTNTWLRGDVNSSWEALTAPDRFQRTESDQSFV